MSLFPIVSWNARALARHSANKFRLKREFFEKSFFKYDVVCIQEAHGTDAIFKKYMHPYLKSHDYFYSPGPDTATGGILTVVKMGLTNKCISPPTFTAVQAGRLGFLTLPLSESCLFVWNVHNYDLKADAMHVASSTIKQQTAAAQTVPLKRLSFFGGRL